MEPIVKTTKGVMPLGMAIAGEKVSIIGIKAGRDLTNQLCGMGIIPGVEIEVINKNSSGAVVVSVFDSRVMIGKGMARQILVR